MQSIAYILYKNYICHTKFRNNCYYCIFKPFKMNVFTFWGPSTINLTYFIKSFHPNWIVKLSGLNCIVPSQMMKWRNMMCIVQCMNNMVYNLLMNDFASGKMQQINFTSCEYFILWYIAFRPIIIHILYYIDQAPICHCWIVASLFITSFELWWNTVKPMSIGTLILDHLLTSNI